MSKCLPPLNSLRVFEVAGRYLNFRRAAEELCVTNAAVSHHIKRLEAHLGLKLFNRCNNQITLSNAGESYLPRVREALLALRQATSLLTDNVNTPLRVTVPPAFGAKWLVPRLYRFFAQHPDIRMEVSTADTQDYDHFDICIDDRRHVSLPHRRVEWLASTDFVPVCNARLQGKIRSPEDLAAHTLLHERDRHTTHSPTWQQWLDEVGVCDIDATRGPAFSNAMLTMQAAIDGQGVALGQSMLVEYDIAAGRLVRPLKTIAPLRLSYCMIYTDQAGDHRGIAAFREWLRDEVSHTDTC